MSKWVGVSRQKMWPYSFMLYWPYFDPHNSMFLLRLNSKRTICYCWSHAMKAVCCYDIFNCMYLSYRAVSTLRHFILSPFWNRQTNVTAGLENQMPPGDVLGSATLNVSFQSINQMIHYHSIVLSWACGTGTSSATRWLTQGPLSLGPLSIGPL